MKMVGRSRRRMKKLKAKLLVPGWELERWERLLSLPEVDLDEEGLPEFSCVFCETAEFEDGTQADLKVCTSGRDGKSVWSEMVAFDSEGNELWFSEVSDGLLGEWEFEIDGVKYEVEVSRRLDAEDAYSKLGCDKEEFCSILLNELENGLSGDYSNRIVDAMADKVAMDVMESADLKEWNPCDVNLGACRVILRACGVNV